MADIVHHGNLKSYISHVLDDSSNLKALVKQLGSITKDVDPEQGYASTLLNLSKRMLMSEKLLAKELGIKLKESQSGPDQAPKSAEDVHTASFSLEHAVIASYNHTERSRNFL
jgi:hypothetical protein